MMAEDSSVFGISRFVIGEIIGSIIAIAIMSALVEVVYGQNYLPNAERYPRAFCFKLKTNLHKYSIRHRPTFRYVAAGNRPLKALGWRVVNI
jgi:hypothetical protein